jgi:pyrroloquinoline quinone (PQQ) biosynthesis protein C
MNFFDSLADTLAEERRYLFSSPIIDAALRGDITREQYVAFLKEAYFHVKQTVPLMMACGSRLRDDQEWLRAAIVHYIDDEYGHEQWILEDMRACGAEPAVLTSAGPSHATELMVSYAWDTVQRNNPVGFFGMVYVLEGTSVALATLAARQVQHALGLPDGAFRYLLSHGSIDQEHVKFLADIVNRFERPADRDAVVHCARTFFYLYAQIFRTMPDPQSATERTVRRHVA